MGRRIRGSCRLTLDGSRLDQPARQTLQSLLHSPVRDDREDCLRLRELLLPSTRAACGHDWIWRALLHICSRPRLYCTVYSLNRANRTKKETRTSRTIRPRAAIKRPNIDTGIEPGPRAQTPSRDFSSTVFFDCCRPAPPRPAPLLSAPLRCCFYCIPRRNAVTRRSNSRCSAERGIILGRARPSPASRGPIGGETQCESKFISARAASPIGT